MSLNIVFIIFLQILSDDEKRSLYDRYGEAGVKGAGMGGMGVSIYASLRHLYQHSDDQNLI